MTQQKPADPSGSDRRDAEDRRTEKRREHDRFVPHTGRSDRRQNERRRDRN
jgi:hypothetical protein